MKFLPFLTALPTVLALSPPTIQSLTNKTDSTANTCYVPVRRWPNHVMIQPRMHQARPDEVSLSPPASPNVAAPASNDTSKHNNSTTPFPQMLPQPPTWVPTLEDLVTAIYRIISIVLTFFNINITWRFHANQAHQPREARHAWAGVRFV